MADKKLSKNERLMLSTVLNLASIVDILTDPDTKDRDKKINVLRTNVAMDAAEAMKRLGVAIPQKKIQTVKKPKIIVPKT